MTNHIGAWEIIFLLFVITSLFTGLGMVVGTDRLQRLYAWVVRHIHRLQPLARVFFGF